MRGFLQAAALANLPLAPEDVKVELLSAPHRPPTNLPVGKMAVYAFWSDGCWLKIGRVGPNSGPRYTSQHYNAGSARSTLAGSLQRCDMIASRSDFTPADIGGWIKRNTHRANALLSSDVPKEGLCLLEAFLHLRLRPRHEG